MGLGLGSIVNTLIGLNPQTLAQAAEEEERKRLAAQTGAATQQAQQAGQAYQQAAAAPPPELGLAELFVPALIGNLASVIGQNPEYAEQGQQRIQQSRAQLLKARADNLQALRDVWGQKAEAAQKMGDIEAESTARMKLESLSKTYDLVSQNAQNAARKEDREQQQAGALALEDRRAKNELTQIAARGGEERKTLQAAGSRADRADRAATTKQGIDPDSGLVLRTFYQREANKLRIAGRQARGGDQKAAVTSGIIENEIQRISGESPMDFYLRLKSVTHPFDRERRGKAKVPKLLFSPEDVISALQTNLTPEEFAILKTRIAARAR